MKTFMANLLLALTWAMVTGTFSGLNLLAGFALGFLVLWIAAPAWGGQSYHLRFVRALRFLAFYVRQLFLSNLRVAHDVLTPRHRMLPGVVAVPLEARTDAEITLLANLITLTPGTLSLVLSPDRGTLYIHAMYIDGGDTEAFRREIKEGLEKRVLELMR